MLAICIPFDRWMCHCSLCAQHATDYSLRMHCKWSWWFFSLLLLLLLFLFLFHVLCSFCCYWNCPFYIGRSKQIKVRSIALNTILIDIMKCVPVDNLNRKKKKFRTDIVDDVFVRTDTLTARREQTQSDPEIHSDFIRWERCDAIYIW